MLGIDAAMVPAERVRLVLRQLRGDDAGPLLRLREGLRTIGSATAPFELATQGTRFVPSEETARFLCVGLGAGEERAAALGRQLDALLERVGVAPSGAEWAGWIALGRLRTERDVAPLQGVVRSYSETVFGQSTIAGMVLESRQVVRGRALTRTIERIPFQARPLPGI